MAEAQFYAPEAPGNATASAMRGIDFGTSLMERATRRRSEEQMQQMRAQEMEENRILEPLRMEKAKADAATGLLNLESARATQEQRLVLTPLIGEARKGFNDIMRLTDTNARAQAGLEWMSKYGQMANLKETQEEFKSYQDIIGKMYIEQQTLNKLTETERLKNTGPDSPIGKMAGDYKKALAAGDQATADWILGGIKSEITPKGMQLEVGPDGGIRFFQGSGDLTTPNTTKSQERQYQQERLIREGGQLMNLLRPEDLGVQGNIGETAGGFLGQLDPKWANEQVAENRTRLRAFREGALRAVSDDSRFSNQDRRAIEEMLPSDGWVENLPQAQGKLKAILTIFAYRAKNEAQRQGKQSWTELPPDELVAQARDGKIDKQAAAAILDALHPDWVKAQTGGK